MEKQEKKLVAVELDPPLNADFTQLIEGAKTLKEAGGSVDDCGFAAGAHAGGQYFIRFDCAKGNGDARAAAPFLPG
ncbi:MAG: hypothetical protein ACLUFF_00240 [Acutalibacteraceae bacterium]